MNAKLKIVADENIPQVYDAFKEYGNITLMPGREIANKHLKDIDVLLVRSVTKVNEQLLTKTNVKCVLTATTGTDHIDLNYINKQGIFFQSADGSNTISVVEYTVSAIIDITINKIKKPVNEISVAVIGYGKIGSRVYDILSTIGYKVIKIDPPLQRKNLDITFSNFNDAFSCNILTFHVPLDHNSQDATYHYLNEFNLPKLTKNAVIINTSRGEVIDNQALSKFLNDNKSITAILDVWENEPNIDTELMNKCYIATPHIAGYSFDAKIKGTEMIYNHFCDFFSFEKKWIPTYPELLHNRILLINNGNYDKLQQLLELFYKIYFLREDHNRLLRFNDNIGKHFDYLRKNYINRREFHNYTVFLEQKDDFFIDVLGKLNFKVII